MPDRWWDKDPDERYWLELSDRDLFGVDLNAPESDKTGKPHSAYALIKDVRPGDIVYHYGKGRTVSPHGIVGWSRVISAAAPDEVIWGPHTGPLSTRPAPKRQSGWRVGLEGPYDVSPKVTLADLRARRPDIIAIKRKLEAAHGSPTFFPFEDSGKRPLRPNQLYLAKLPKAFVDLFPALAAARVPTFSPPAPSPVPSAGAGIGDEYTPEPEPDKPSAQEPFTTDPDVIDRGKKGHWRTQEALAAHVRGLGASPRKARPREPRYDLAWERKGSVFVAEVKSLTADNEERQLRLGLGQVLRYAHVLRTMSPKPVRPVLAVERAPMDPTWPDLCAALDVILVWPANLSSLS